jgi:hypothetical protein
MSEPGLGPRAFRMPAAPLPEPPQTAPLRRPRRGVSYHSLLKPYTRY